MIEELKEAASKADDAALAEQIVSQDGDVIRTLSGERVAGHKVAAWRYRAHADQDSWPYRYCEHWSTPGEGARDVQRLFTEDQLRSLIATHEADRARIAELEGANEHLRGVLDTIFQQLSAAHSLMLGAGHWTNEAGHRTDASLWIERAEEQARLAREGAHDRD
jgi:hypothetical protein